MTVRDEREDYRRAYVAEYEAYRAHGLDERAAGVSQVLKESFGHNVEPVVEPVAEPVLERADVEAAPETAVPRKPGRPRKPVQDPES